MSSRSTSFSNMVLDARILALPVGHLQFSESVRLVLRQRETIGGLIAAANLRRPRWRPRVRSEICLVLDVLTRCMRYGTAKGWEQFRTQRPKAADATAIYFTSFSFDRLRSSVRSLLVGTLHLTTRVATALARAKIRTIDDLIYAAICGIVSPHPGGAGTCLEIIEILEALSQAVEPSGECDWSRYTECRRILLLPRRPDWKFMAEDYINDFRTVIQRAVLTSFGQRGAILARDNLLCAKRRRKSSARIAKHLSIPRQQVDVLRKLIVQSLGNAFLNDDYTGCCFRFRAEFVAPLKTLAADLSRVRGRAIGYSEWNKILSRCLLMTSGALAPTESGLLETLGFQLVTFTQTRFKPLILPCGREPAPFRRALMKAEQLLMTHFAAGCSKAELFGELNRWDKGGHFVEGDMRAVIESLPGIRRLRGTDRYQCRLRDVRYIRDQLQRALDNRGRPAHFRELASLLKEMRPTDRTDIVRSTALALSSDKRFKPIGRSGCWALAEWSVETRPIADVANVFFAQHDRPATEAELFEFISRRRNVSRQSIGTLLGKDDRFMRVAPGTWALSRRVHSGNRSKEVGFAPALGKTSESDSGSIDRGLTRYKVD